MSSALFSPIKLADLTLPNRIVVAPMCQYSADDGVANNWHMTHLGMLANSGAGLLVLEATHVERHGRITHGCMGIYSDDCEDALKRVVLHCKRIGHGQARHPARPCRAQGVVAAPVGRRQGARPERGSLADDRAVGAAVRPRLAYAARHERGRHGARAQSLCRWRQSAQCALASMPSSCIWRTAICCTASSRRCPTSAMTTMAARSPAACAFRSKSRARRVPRSRATFRSAPASPAPIGSTAA